MLYCIQCGYYARREFLHFCRICYRILIGQLQITKADFINYINSSFDLELTYPPYWRFRDVHRWLQSQHPSTKSLASIFESIIDLRMFNLSHPAFTREVQLANSRSISNPLTQ